MTRRMHLGVFAGLFVVAAFAVAIPDQQTVAPPPRKGADRGPDRVGRAAPRLTAREVNRQDRMSQRERRRQLESALTRPLLSLLPLDLAGAHLDVAGIAPSGKVLLRITPGAQGRADAQATLRRTLEALDDPGTAYEIRWKP